MGKKDDPKPQPRQVTCPLCHGKGHLSYQVTDPKGNQVWTERKCSRCDGRGTVTVS